MADINVKVIDGVVDGNPIGTEISVSKDSANYLVSRGFVEITPNQPKSKKASAPKKTSKKKESAAKTKTKDAVKKASPTKKTKDK